MSNARLHIFIFISLIAISACEDPFAAENIRFYKSVATGGEHSCAVSTDGAAYCWGKGSDGQLGTGDESNRATPSRVQGNFDFEQITAGLAHTCALATDGTALCWGSNVNFQPVPLATTVKFRSISAGKLHTCAISVDSLAYCWGNNTFGQLGDSSTMREFPLPNVVGGNHRFVQISAGGWHTCALTAPGRAYCWGRNDQGQVGTGSIALQVVAPTPVNTTVSFLQIDGGATHTCAVAADTRFYCWGGNEFGEAGVGGASGAGPGLLTPTPISEFFPNGAAIAAGEHHTCAVHSNGQARCWGRGIYGQLGNGAVVTHYHPQPIYLQPNALHQGDLFTIHELATGGLTHMCVLSEERVYCWGTGNSGQLGVPGSAFTLLPQRVGN